jgi:hypothetical protein
MNIKKYKEQIQILIGVLIFFWLIFIVSVNIPPSNILEEQLIDITK